MTFRNPTLFALMVIPVTAVVIYALYWAWRRRVVARAGDVQLVEEMIASRSGRRDVASFVMVALGLVLLVVALAGPQWGDREREVERRGIDIVFAVDISRSMLAQDTPPSRLEAARNEIVRVLRRLDGDRVGLVAFAGIAFAQCPLTTDYHAVRTFLDMLDPEAMPVQGTAVGRAISESVRLLTGLRQSTQDGERASAMPRGHDQILVLFTDGEDHETQAEEAAAEARAEGIRVFAVPIGTEDGAEIPLYSRDGQRTGSLTTATGEVVVSRLQTQTLEDVAKAGGGQIIPYRGEGTVAEVLSREVDELMAGELEDILRPEREDRFYFFLAPAILLILLGTALSDRRRGHSNGLDVALGLGLALLLAGLPGCGDPFVTESDQVAEGLELSLEGSGQAALEEIHQFRTEIAQADLLDAPALDYNEGVVLLRDGQLDQARSRFHQALGSSSPEVRFRSYYNLGNAAFLLEDYDEALERYRQALELRPDDDDAKWNLEVTLRRLFPPCFTLEDPFEDNDRPEEATPVDQPQAPAAGGPASAGAAPVQPPVPGSDESTEVERILCGGDADWYRVEGVSEGAWVGVTASFHRLRDDTGGAVLPDEIPPEAVHIALYEGDGNTVLGSDAGEADLEAGRERVAAEELTRSIPLIQLPPGAAPSGTLFIEIDANLGLEYRYDLDVTVIPPCDESEDSLEDNDTPETAAPLEPGETPLMSCGGDDDWFRIPVELGDSVFVDIRPGPDESPSADGSSGGETEHTVGLDAALYGSEVDEPLDTSRGRDGLLELALTDIGEPGDRLLRVSAVEPQGRGHYLLTVSLFPPCIVGDDPFEDNDSLETVASIDPSQGPQRHLRLCDGDDDWFAVPLTQGEHFSLSAWFAEEPRELSLALLDPTSSAVLAFGTAAELVAPEPADTTELGPPPPRARFGRQIHIEDPPTTGPYAVRVWGDPGFYNLEFPDPDSDQSCDNPQRDDQDQQDSQDQQQSQDQQEDQDQQDQQQNQDQQDQQENQEQEASQDDQEGQPEEQPDTGERQEPDPERRRGDEQEQAQSEPEPTEQGPDSELEPQGELGELSEEEAAEERRRRRLESLAADQDLNLQLEQALDNMQPIRVENQW